MHDEGTCGVRIRIQIALTFVCWGTVTSKVHFIVIEVDSGFVVELRNSFGTLLGSKFHADFDMSIGCDDTDTSLTN